MPHINDTDMVYQGVLRLLEHKGSITDFDSLTTSIVYKDRKINVEGIVDIKDRVRYVSIAIAVYLPHGAEENNSPFRLSVSNRKDWTTVYQWNEYRRYERPGRWQKYLQKLLSDIDEQQRPFLDLNGQPVEDAALFSDIADD